jgi:hypothetical protein
MPPLVGVQCPELEPIVPFQNRHLTAVQTQGVAPLALLPPPLRLYCVKGLYLLELLQACVLEHCASSTLRGSLI